jgi:hypothetical protein
VDPHVDLSGAARDSLWGAERGARVMERGISGGLRTGKTEARGRGGGAAAVADEGGIGRVAGEGDQQPGGEGVVVQRVAAARKLSRGLEASPLQQPDGAAAPSTAVLTSACPATSPGADKHPPHANKDIPLWRQSHIPLGSETNRQPQGGRRGGRREPHPRGPCSQIPSSPTGRLSTKALSG